MLAVLARTLLVSSSWANCVGGGDRGNLTVFEHSIGEFNSCIPVLTVRLVRFSRIVQ